MIHHLSISADNPLHVARVLAELFDGEVGGVGPYRNSYAVWAKDRHGTAIDVLPTGTEMHPDTGSGQAHFHHNAAASGYTATHAAVSISCDTAKVLAIAAREGWRALEPTRGAFRVIEFWIENRVMLELMTEEMTQEYLQATMNHSR